MKRIPPYELCCNRCEHRWLRRVIKTEPKQCPKCKSPYWNKERVRPIH